MPDGGGAIWRAQRDNERVGGNFRDCYDNHMNSKLEQLYALIDGIDVVMLANRRPDGTLAARPMQTQAQRSECDLWFAAYDDAHVLEELDRDPRVCLCYQNNASGEYISVSGDARVIYEGAGAAHIEVTIDKAMRFVGRASEVVYERERTDDVDSEELTYFG